MSLAIANGAGLPAIECREPATRLALVSEVLMTRCHRRFPMFAVLALVGNGSAAFARGELILSGRNQKLAINAWEGAQQGTVLRLHNACDLNNPDCTWTYRNRMLISDSNPKLAINAWDGAKHGTVLRLNESCRADNPDCTWTYRGGMFISDRDPTLAINAWDGAQHGTVLRLHSGCRPDNPNCTWVWNMKKFLKGVIRQKTEPCCIKEVTVGETFTIFFSLLYGDEGWTTYETHAEGTAGSPLSLLGDAWQGPFHVTESSERRVSWTFKAERPGRVAQEFTSRESATSEGTRDGYVAPIDNWTIVVREK